MSHTWNVKNILYVLSLSLSVALILSFTWVRLYIYEGKTDLLLLLREREFNCSIYYTFSNNVGNPFGITECVTFISMFFFSRFNLTRFNSNFVMINQKNDIVFL